MRQTYTDTKNLEKTHKTYNTWKELKTRLKYSSVCVSWPGYLPIVTTSSAIGCHGHTSTSWGHINYVNFHDGCTPIFTTLKSSYNRLLELDVLQSLAENEVQQEEPEMTEEQRKEYFNRVNVSHFTVSVASTTHQRTCVQGGPKVSR